MSSIELQNPDGSKPIAVAWAARDNLGKATAGVMFSESTDPRQSIMFGMMILRATTEQIIRRADSSGMPAEQARRLMNAILTSPAEPMPGPNGQRVEIP